MHPLPTWPWKVGIVLKKCFLGKGHRDIKIATDCITFSFKCSYQTKVSFATWAIFFHLSAPQKILKWNFAVAIFMASCIRMNALCYPHFKWINSLGCPDNFTHTGSCHPRCTLQEVRFKIISNIRASWKWHLFILHLVAVIQIFCSWWLWHLVHFALVLDSSLNKLDMLEQLFALKKGHNFNSGLISPWSDFCTRRSTALNFNEAGFMPKSCSISSH